MIVKWLKGKLFEEMEQDTGDQIYTCMARKTGDGEKWLSGL